MFEFFASLFGYLLEIIYNLLSNYGVAIILFTVVIKLMLLPLSLKQQRTMKKTTKMQEKMKIIQFKYKNDQEKMNQEMMNLYKEEKMSPFSGCLTAIIQILLLISIFYLVRCPLTYMQKMNPETISKYTTQLQEAGKTTGNVYQEIDIIREYEWLKEQNPDDENIEKINIHMDFLGLDLSKIPQQNLNDFTVYIIPVLYIISTFISMRITTAMQKKQTNKDQKALIDGKTGKEEKQEDNNEIDTIMETNKMMSWMMPIMSVSIALIAPLGLALYWLVNNILMIIERIVLDKVIKLEEE